MAVHEHDIKTETYLAAGDLSAHQYNVMRLSDGVNQINVNSNALTNAMLGVLVNKPNAAGRHATVAYGGRYKVRAGAAISSAGLFLTTNGSGRAIAAASGQVVFGKAIEIAAADGDLITVQLMDPWRLSGQPGGDA